jgi:glutamate dehydrogenase
VLAQELVETDLPDDPFLEVDLLEYFPEKMRTTYADQIRQHPLRREIVTTATVNELINGAGITFYHRLSEETGSSAEEIVRANFVAREIYGSRPFVDTVFSYDNRIATRTQMMMRLQMRTLVERATRWLLNNRRPPLDSQATVDWFRPMVADLLEQMPDIVVGEQRDLFDKWRTGLEEQGVPADLARRAAILPLCYSLLSVVETARRDDLDPLLVARTHLLVGEKLSLPILIQRIFDLPRNDRWQTMARAALRDDLYGVHAALTSQVLERTGGAGEATDEAVEDRIAKWEADDAVLVERAVQTLREICTDDRADLARMSVGLRVVRTLLSS